MKSTLKAIQAAHNAFKDEGLLPPKTIEIDVVAGELLHAELNARLNDTCGPDRVWGADGKMTYQTGVFGMMVRWPEGK
jgi:hypothetical protein